MGQYYIIVNLDKKQYLHPLKFGDGLKLMEFATSQCGVLTALAILLADGNGRGGGDLNSDDPIIGSWAGDRIVIAGDYADEGKFIDDPKGKKQNLYAYAEDNFEDISERVLRVMMEDWVVASELLKAAKYCTTLRRTLEKIGIRVEHARKS